MKSGLLKKKIPTLVGLAVLTLGLIIGTVFFSRGTGVFSPRATPQTTPTDVQISNVSDKGFTVSFFTAEKTVGFVKFGENPNSLKLQASDERDQLHGTIGEYQAHYISVGGLKPSTKYYFILGTVSHSSFDNKGVPFTVQTAKKAMTPPAAKTIYGSVVTRAGTPAKDTIVYVKLEGAGLLSSLVKNSGSWAVPLSNARTSDGTGYAPLNDQSILVIAAKGVNKSDTATINTTVAEFQSGGTITLGEKNSQVAVAPTTSLTPSPSLLTPSVSLSPTATPTSSITATATPTLTQTPTPTNRRSSGDQLANLLPDDNNLTPTPTGGTNGQDEVNLEATTDQVVYTSEPKLNGVAKPNVKVKITIHSNNQIETETTADEQGNFQIDIAALSQKLEPGEHSIEYTYTDPQTGEEITKTQTFVVKDPNAETNNNQLAMAEISPTPTPTLATYGTEAPYSSTATDSASASASITPTIATRSAVPDASATSLPKSGIIDNTLILIFGGLFFILSGAWSFWIASELQQTD